MSKTILGWMALAVLAVLLFAAAMFMRDMNRAYEHVRERGTVFASPQGDIEYTEGGAGVPVLVIHGSGGGYDQGELIAQAVLGDGFHWIAPSRFGYLRSALPASATFDEQAHVPTPACSTTWACSGCGRRGAVAWRALSAAVRRAGPRAGLVAHAHLGRRGVVRRRARDAGEPEGDMLKAVLRHDAFYWAVATLYRRSRRA